MKVADPGTIQNLSKFCFLFLGGSDSAEDDDEEEEEENNPNASNAVGTGGPHPCVVCKAVLEHHGQSRPLPKHQASQYGLQVCLPLSKIIFCFFMKRGGPLTFRAFTGIRSFLFLGKKKKKLTRNVWLT